MNPKLMIGIIISKLRAPDFPNLSVINHHIYTTNPSEANAPRNGMKPINNIISAYHHSFCAIFTIKNMLAIGIHANHAFSVFVLCAIFIKANAEITYAMNINTNIPIKNAPKNARPAVSPVNKSFIAIFQVFIYNLRIYKVFYLVFIHFILSFKKLN